MTLSVLGDKHVIIIKFIKSYMNISEENHFLIYFYYFQLNIACKCFTNHAHFY